MERKFVVVGSGRSGSGYIAKVLSAAAIPCGHEAWWGPTTDSRPYMGDSNWMASLFPDELPPLVFHQVRHPLAVVSSHYKAWNRGDDYWKYKRRFLTEETGDNIVDAMQVYVNSNRACESLTDMRWRLEDVDADLVVNIGAKVGVRVRGEVAVHAINSVPGNYNSHGRGALLKWVDLPQGDLREELVEMAAQYGYQP